MLRAALDAGINFIDTAPVYGDDGVGETLLADVLANRDDIVLTTKCGYDIAAERNVPRPVGAPARLAARVDPAAGRGVAAAARHRPHRPLPAAQRRIEPILDDDLVGDARRAEGRGQGPRARRRARPGDRLGRGGRSSRSTTARSSSLQTVFNVLEQEPGLTFAARAARSADGEASLISRVPHASDTLSGKVTPDTVFPPERPPRPPQPRQHARQLREGRDAARSSGTGDGPHDRPGRDRRHPRQPGVHHACCRPCVTSTRCASTPPPRTSRSPTPRRDDARRRCARGTSTTTTATRCR